MSAVSAIETAVEAKHDAATRKNALSDAGIQPAPGALGDSRPEEAARPAPRQRDAQSPAARRARQPLRLVVARVDPRVADAADARAGAAIVAGPDIAVSCVAVPDGASSGPGASYPAASRGTVAGRRVDGRAFVKSRAVSGPVASGRRTATSSCLAGRAQPGVARRQLAVAGSTGSLMMSGAGRSVRTIPAGPIRLTRRGRAVAVVGVVIVIVAIALVLLLVTARGAAATSNGRPGAGYQGMHEVVVQPGQTLWAIALAAEPTANTAAVVQEIMIANAMTSTTLTAGQLLWVPR